MTDRKQYWAERHAQKQYDPEYRAYRSRIARAWQKRKREEKRLQGESKSQ